jgi:RIO-like serine/threonine protein kinase
MEYCLEIFEIIIFQGMNCLFQKSIVHGDLTAKNVLLTKDLTAKICDLGWAKKLENEEENVEYRRNDPTFQPLW